MSVSATTSSQALVVTSATARDQAESLARGNARPDDGFWRGVFDRAGGEAGMAGAGSHAWGESPGAEADAPRTLALQPRTKGFMSTAPDEHDAGVATRVNSSGLMNRHIKAPLQEEAPALGVALALAGVVGSEALISSQRAARQIGVEEAQDAARARPGGGAPYLSGKQPLPVVVTVAAGASDDVRVFLRGQGLSLTQAMSLASQAVAEASAEPGRPIVSVALNGRTIYSAGETGRDDASGSTCFSLTA